MTHLKKKRSMLAATIVLCGVAPATPSVAQTYSYPAGTSSPSTIGASCAPGLVRVVGPTPTNYATQPQVNTPTRVVQGNGQVIYYGGPPTTVRMIPDPRTGGLVVNPNPPPAPVYCVRPAPPSSPPPRPPQARNVGYGVPVTNGPCASTTSGAVMSPCVGRTGSLIQLQLTRPLPATPGFLFFSAVPTPGVPSGVRSGLTGSGSSYSASVPAALCMSGGGTWYVYLRLSTGQDMGLIGSYTPNNCT